MKKGGKYISGVPETVAVNSLWFFFPVFTHLLYQDVCLRIKTLQHYILYPRLRLDNHVT